MYVHIPRGCRGGVLKINSNPSPRAPMQNRHTARIVDHSASRSVTNRRAETYILQHGDRDKGLWDRSFRALAGRAAIFRLW